MFIVKWISILAFILMVCAGIYHFAGDVTQSSKICYITAGIFVCGVFYVTTLHKIFPKSGMGERVADILEKTVDARQIALMHHIQHEHQGQLGSLKQLSVSSQEADVITMPPSSYQKVVSPERGDLPNLSQKGQPDGTRYSKAKNWDVY